MNVHDFMEHAGNNFNIVNAIAKTWDILDRFSHPVCSISGGSDSDILLDIIHKLDEQRKVRYVWFNTGLEFNATKRHLDDLEQKYSISIERVPAVKPIPVTVRESGYPFLSKFVSNRIAQLQRHHFHFRLDSDYEQDMRDFDHCKDGLDWWHNKRSYRTFNISRFYLLKEFLAAYTPDFSISDKCCDFSKKLPAKHFIRDNSCDLNIIGTRKLEGGIRQSLTSCFSQSDDEGAIFRPIFWFKNSDKKAYCNLFGVSHSDCYTVYGLERTGCVGCPFNPHAEKELEQCELWEKGIVNAARNVFAKSYEFTKLFRAFRLQLRDATLPLFNILQPS